MIFPKKQAQRLIPEYLLDYTTKLNESHPDPTESWGGSGSNYTAGDGININENVISVDDTIAKKSEIPTNYVTLDTEQTITSPKTINSQLNFGDGVHNSILINADYANNPIISMLKDTTGGEFSIGVDDGSYFTYEDDNGLKKYKLPYQDATGINTYTLATTSDIPSLDGYATQTWVQEQGYKTSITSSDITTALGYTPGTSNFSGSYNDLTDTPTLATVATSGSYNDLTDKPKIPTIPPNYVTTDTNQVITGSKEFDGDIIVDGGTLLVKDILRHNTYITPTGFNFNYTDIVDKVKHRTWFKLPTGKPSGTPDNPTEYTLATTDDIVDATKFVTLDTEQTITALKTFTGGLRTENTNSGKKMNVVPGEFDYTYNNQGTIEYTNFKLPTSKPSSTNGIPKAYTLATTDDIHNPTITFTQGGTTKGTITLNQSGDQTIALDAGGSGGGDTPTNMVTTDTTQDITGEKTFVGSKRIKFKQSNNYDKLGFTGYDYDNTEIGYLEMSKMDNSFTGNPISNILGYYSNVNSAPNPSADVMLGFKYFTKDSDGNTRNYNLVVPPRYNELRATRYIPISVNGTTADNTGNINVPTETLVFTLADNSTVTVNVMTSNTTTTTS